MSNGANYENFGDLLTATTNSFKRTNILDIASKHQKYWFNAEIVKRAETIAGGLGPDWTLMHDENYSARFVGLFADDEVNINDVLVRAYVPWRHVTANDAYEEREAAMNSGKDRLVDELKARRAARDLSLANKFEDAWWGNAPATDDELTWYGINYWITRWPASGTVTVGLYGTYAYDYTNGAAYTSGPGGVSPDTYAFWRNWTAQYSVINKTDGIESLSEIYTKMQWEPPMQLPGQPGMYSNMAMQLYCNYDSYKEFKAVGEGQNENLGRDVDSMAGKIVFRGHPINYVSYLDGDAGDPVFMVDQNTFGMCMLKGEEMTETPYLRNARKHKTWESFKDCTGNSKCTMRRRNAVISKTSSSGTSS